MAGRCAVPDRRECPSRMPTEGAAGAAFRPSTGWATSGAAGRCAVPDRCEAACAPTEGAAGAGIPPSTDGAASGAAGRCAPPDRREAMCAREGGCPIGQTTFGCGASGGAMPAAPTAGGVSGCALPPKGFSGMAAIAEAADVSSGCVESCRAFNAASSSACDAPGSSVVTVKKEAAGADSKCTGHAYDAAKCVTERLPSDYGMTARLKKGGMQGEGTVQVDFVGKQRHTCCRRTTVACSATAAAREPSSACCAAFSPAVPTHISPSRRHAKRVDNKWLPSLRILITYQVGKQQSFVSKISSNAAQQSASNKFACPME